MTAPIPPRRRRKGKPAAAGLRRWLQARRDARSMREFGALRAIAKTAQRT